MTYGRRLATTTFIVGLVSIAIEACVLAYVANKLLVKRFHSAVIYAIFIAIQTIRRFIINGDVWSGAALNIVSLILILTICYRGDVRKKVALLISYCAITMSCEIIISVLVSMAFGKGLTFEEPLVVFTAYAVHKLALFFLAFLFLKIYKKDFYIKEWLKYFPVPIGIFFALHWFMDVRFENRDGFAEVLTIAILGFLTCIFMIGYVQYRESQKRTAERLDMARKKEQLSVSFNNIIRKTVQQNERISHDSRHHIEYLASIGNSEVREYVAKVMKLECFNFNLQITGNRDVDCVLYSKQIRAQENGIRFNVSGLLPKQIDFLDPIDIVTILSNGLANALDACEKIEEGEKFVNVGFRFDKHLSIRIDNSFVEAPVEKEFGWFKSTKKGYGHGLGMESIQEAVNRYQGHMETVIEDEIFSLRIMLQQVKPS